RNGVNERHIDAHAGFERAELLEALALLQRRWRQGNEALERGAAIGVEAYMVVVRAAAMRHGQAAEIKSSRDADTRRKAGGDLHDAGIAELFRILDRRGQRRDID